MPNVMQQLFIMNIESLLKEYAAYKAFNKSDCVINMRIPRPILDKIKELNPDGEFILMQDGRQLNANSFNRWLKRYCEECNIPVRSSHKIRFCVASILYDNGVPLTVLQQLLGHTTTAMTLHYLRRVTPTKDTANLMNMALC